MNLIRPKNTEFPPPSPPRHPSEYDHVHLATVQLKKRKSRFLDSEDHPNRKKTVRGNQNVRLGHASAPLSDKNDPPTLRPAVLLSGFTWSEAISEKILTVIAPYNATSVLVSIQVSDEMRSKIQWDTGIVTDWVKVVCHSLEEQERMIRDLYRARFAWTHPWLEVQAWESNSSGSLDHPIPSHTPAERS
ncbi:hypothetical protein LZ554_004739 [Drepanopeziza brunnea f. sp. 'monogermtubi']|nr:hypothetical protein LZ554_004739 [Drepanopeziza brunnea f. sp. 'monogermtubi']